MKKYNLLITAALVFFILINLGASIYVNNIKQTPKYTYSVRENIEDFIDGQSFELWCWREMENGSIEKEYIGNFTLQGDIKRVQRVNTSLCR